MPIKPLDVFSGYDKQRFEQFSPCDMANWYSVKSPTGKKGQALYPAMGRKHITIDKENILIFGQQPRKIFKSIDFVYIVVGRTIWQLNKAWELEVVSIPSFTQSDGTLNFAYLPVIQTPGTGVTQHVFCMFCTGNQIFVIDELNASPQMTLVTDANQPKNPLFPVAFGNRFAVSSENSTQFQLTQINMGGVYDPNAVFTIPGGTPLVFAQESGIIRQMATLQNQLYIFTDYSTGIWSNNPSQFDSGTGSTTTFPWRKNTSFQFNFGIADPDSLDVDFGMMVWLAQNRNGLVTFVMSSGQSPEPISTPAINVLLQKIANASEVNPLLETDTVGFLYQYEDSVFYRASIGPYVDFKTLDDASFSNCLEFNFDTKTWQRLIEVNGQRNRVEEHEFFNNKHLVTVEQQTAVYEMAGNIYFNELQNPLVTNPQDPLAFLAYPMRYENVTPIISEEDYSEFITEYIEIDFVFGDNTYISWQNGFANTVFIIGELPDTNGDPVYMVAQDGVTFIIEEGTSTPVLDESIYSDLFKPHIELYISDDGGISFFSADVLEFSQLGIYQWRMRWYQGGPSRNRVYKLVAVSAAPIVVLGAVQNTRRVSGGAN